MTNPHAGRTSARWDRGIRQRAGVTVLVLACLVGLALGACRPPYYDSGSSSSGSTYTTPSSSSSPSSSPSSTYTPAAPAAQPASLQFQRVSSSSGNPEITIKNEYGVTQYVFVDGSLLGSVVSGGSATFRVAPGSHRVTVADSASITDNPASTTADIQRGQQLVATVSSRPQ